MVLYKFTFVPTNVTSLDKKNVLFFEFVIKCNGNVILRIPFGKQKRHHIELYGHDDKINNNRILQSMSPSVARVDTNAPITCHFNKVIEVNDNIGIITNIMEQTSSTQDITVFEIPNTRFPPFITEFTVFDKIPKLNQIHELKLIENKLNSKYWLTQRNFYSSSHTTNDQYCHKQNLHLLIHEFYRKFEHYENMTLLSMLVELGNVMTKDRLIYHCDTPFTKGGKYTDTGNASIETSTTGDCEDFGHFYMRIFRLMASTYHLVLNNKSSKLYKLCHEFASFYTPMLFICQINQGGGLEFHCTMMIMSSNIDKYPNISFEVTNPSISTLLPSRKFYSWHKDQYFLVDNYFIARCHDVTLDYIDIHSLEFFNY